MATQGKSCPAVCNALLWAKISSPRSCFCCSYLIVLSHSRFIFFTDTDEDSEVSAFESLHRSNKTAIQSVAAALRIDTEDDDEDLLDVIIDPAQGI